MVNLHGGPYLPPACKIGDWLTCVIRGDQEVAGFTNGWPVARPLSGGGARIIVTEELREAIETESATALALLIGISKQAVSRYRKALGVKDTPGSSAVRKANIARIFTIEVRRMGGQASAAKRWGASPAK